MNIVHVQYEIKVVVAFVVVEMKCLLCSLHFIQKGVLKKHYVDYHFINDQDIFFKDLFTPDTIDKTCRFCKETFKSSRSKKTHVSFSLRKTSADGWK